MAPTVDRFVGDFAFLSNFYRSVIYVDGRRYATVEHAYQAAKTSDVASRELIRKAKTPSLAKKLGQAVTLRADWDAVRLQVMEDLVRKKFENPFLRPMLLATAGAELVEGNLWNDTFFGVCRGVGQNWLGKLLMKVRDEIADEQAREAAEASAKQRATEIP